MAASVHARGRLQSVAEFTTVRAPPLSCPAGGRAKPATIHTSLLHSPSPARSANARVALPLAFRGGGLSPSLPSGCRPRQQRPPNLVPEQRGAVQGEMSGNRGASCFFWPSPVVAGRSDEPASKTIAAARCPSARCHARHCLARIGPAQRLTLPRCFFWLLLLAAPSLRTTRQACALPEVLAAAAANITEVMRGANVKPAVVEVVEAHITTTTTRIDTGAGRGEGAEERRAFGVVVGGDAEHGGGGAEAAPAAAPSLPPPPPRPL